MGHSPSLSLGIFLLLIPLLTLAVGLMTARLIFDATGEVKRGKRFTLQRIAKHPLRTAFMVGWIAMGASLFEVATGNDHPWPYLLWPLETGADLANFASMTPLLSTGITVTFSGVMLLFGSFLSNYGWHARVSWLGLFMAASSQVLLILGIISGTFACIVDGDNVGFLWIGSLLLWTSLLALTVTSIFSLNNERRIIGALLPETGAW